MTTPPRGWCERCQAAWGPQEDNACPNCRLRLSFGPAALGRLELLIERHIAPDWTDPTSKRMSEYGVAVAELRNVVRPNSAPMYPADSGHAATCSLCCPKGNGAKRGKPWPPEGKT